MIPFHVYMLALTLLVGLVRSVWRCPPPLRIVAFLLVPALIAELTHPLRLFGLNGQNTPVMNIYVLLELLCMALVFRLAFNRARHRKLVLITVLPAIGSWAFDLYRYGNLDSFYAHSYGAILLAYILWCLLYFKELLSETHVGSPLSDPFFWVSTGVFFFSLGMFLYIAAFVYIGYNADPKYSVLWDNLANVLNTAQYLCFIMAFFSGRRRIYA
jgi:hypothetical protein